MYNIQNEQTSFGALHFSFAEPNTQGWQNGVFVFVFEFWQNERLLETFVGAPRVVCSLELPRVAPDASDVNSAPVGS